MSTTNYYLVLSTTPDLATAQQIAEQLLQAQLAACVNIVPAITSVYYWQGKLQTSQESQLFIKTKASALSELFALIKQLHPYEVPELIALPIVKGQEQYLQWIDSSLTKAAE